MAVTCTLSTTITVSAASFSSPPAVRPAAAEASSRSGMAISLRCMAEREFVESAK